MFSINKNDPAKLKMVGQPVSTGGEFPMSLTISHRSGQVCILNGGRVNGVNCFKQDPLLGLIQMDNTQRSLNLNLTSPPAGPAGSLSHIIFNEDGSQLLASVKGIPPVPGFVASWNVDPKTGALSEEFSRFTPGQGGGLPFGMAVIPGKNAILVTDPASGFDIFNINNGTSASSTIVPIKGQSDTCWAAFSNKTGNFYLTDIGTSMVTEVHVDDNLHGTIVNQYPQGNGTATIDDEVATINGQDFLYVMGAGATSIMVLSLEGPGQAKSVQRFNFKQVATKHGMTIDSNNVQGMAVFVPQ